MAGPIAKPKLKAILSSDKALVCVCSELYDLEVAMTAGRSISEHKALQKSRMHNGSSELTYWVAKKRIAAVDSEKIIVGRAPTLSVVQPPR